MHSSPPTRLSPKAALAIRASIGLAGGREVCFVCGVDEDGVIGSARVVARGDVRSVLALPGFAQRGEMLVHNHPSGVLEPSSEDMEIAARVHDDGIGFGIVNNAATELYVVVEVPKADVAIPLDVDAIRAATPQEVAGPVVYEALAQAGLVYGPHFQSIETLWCGVGEALGRLRAPASTTRPGERLTVPLDAAFQVVGGAVRAEERGQTYLPAAVA